MKKIELDDLKTQIPSLFAGEEILLSGVIYTARDQAHKRMLSLIAHGKGLPFDVRGKTIYYCGPTATPKGKIIGACGPTTSSRMDNFVKPLLAKGLLGMIGKGRRSSETVKLIKRYKSIYFVAPAGCGALLASRVVGKKLIAFSELGPEAVYALTVKDFPVYVAVDAHGNDIYAKIALK